jgi:hypothetical protein
LQQQRSLRNRFGSHDNSDAAELLVMTLPRHPARRSRAIALPIRTPTADGAINQSKPPYDCY